MNFTVDFDSKEMSEFLENGYNEVRKGLKKNIPKSSKKLFNEIAKRDKKSLGNKMKSPQFKKRNYSLGKLKHSGPGGVNMHVELSIKKKPTSVDSYKTKQKNEGVEFTFRGGKKVIKGAFKYNGKVYIRGKKTDKYKPGLSRIPIRSLRTGGVYGAYITYDEQELDHQKFFNILADLMRGHFD